MAIATGTALALGTAALGAGAGIYGASKASKAQSKAADTASDTAQYTAQMNNQLARDMYASNSARLDPFATNGLMASNALTDMLLGTSKFNPNASPYAGTLADPANPASPAAKAGAAPYTEAQIAAAWNDGVRGNAEAMQNANNQWYASQPAANALAPIAGAPTAAPTAPTAAPVAATPATNALAPVAGSTAPLEAQAQEAVAAGANPNLVKARLAIMQHRNSILGAPVGLGGI